MVADTLVEPSVSDAHRLVQPLDEDGCPIRSAMWVFNPDTGVWRLWLTARTAVTDKREFYSRTAGLISRHRKDFRELDPGDVELVQADHPALSALRSFARVEGISSVRVSSNMLNGYYLPDGIIIRMT